MIKCSSQCTESLYGWLYIIKLNRRVKDELRVRSLNKKRSFVERGAWPLAWAFSENEKYTSLPVRNNPATPHARLTCLSNSLERKFEEHLPSVENKLKVIIKCRSLHQL